MNIEDRIYVLTHTHTRKYYSAIKKNLQSETSEHNKKETDIHI